MLSKNKYTKHVLIYAKLFITFNSLLYRKIQQKEKATTCTIKNLKGGFNLYLYEEMSNAVIWILEPAKKRNRKKRANILYVPACYHIKNIMFNDPQNKQLVLHAQGARSFPYLLSCYLFEYTYLYLYKAVSKVARKEAKEEGGAIVNYSDKPSHAGDGFYGNRIR